MLTLSLMYGYSDDLRVEQESAAVTDLYLEQPSKDSVRRFIEATLCYELTSKSCRLTLKAPLSNITQHLICIAPDPIRMAILAAVEECHFYKCETFNLSWRRTHTEIGFTTFIKTENEPQDKRLWSVQHKVTQDSISRIAPHCRLLIKGDVLSLLISAVLDVNQLRIIDSTED